MDVQVCSLRDSDFDIKFRQSLTETGFAVVTHHGVDYSLIRNTQEAWREFFQMGNLYQRQFINPLDSNMGFKGFGQEKAIGASVADLKLFYHWKPGQVIPNEVSALTQKLYSLLEGDVAGRLLHALNQNESISTDFVESCRNGDNTVLRALYYPALDDIEREPESVRAAAHQDINFLTLLVAASAPGLEVQNNNGDWYKVPFEENSLIVNVGDMLELASGGLYKSTTHRVVNPDNSRADRLSIPLFIHPHGNTLLAPGVTAQQFLNERLNTIYSGGYGK